MHKLIAAAKPERNDNEHAPRRLRRGACFVLAMLAGTMGIGFAQDPVRDAIGDVGYVALHQAVLDAGSDNLALIVASHPDDRYVMPATYLRFEHGMRVAILLFTRGKGGQNSGGPETGDALGAIRTQESERCAKHLGAKVYYLNRPDNGYSRSAAETLKEWDEDRTVRDVARLIRKIQPDMVLTTHHPEENHGHDLALMKILPRAVFAAADPKFEADGQKPYSVSRLFRGAMSTEEEEVSFSISMDHKHDVRGHTYRQLAYQALLEHRSQAPLQEMDTLLQPILEMVSMPIGDQPLRRTLLDRLPSLFDVLPPEPPSGKEPLRPGDFRELSSKLASPPELSTDAIALRRRLRAIPTKPNTDLALRMRRRMAALERVILLSSGVQVFMKIPPGSEAAPGEEMPLQIWIGNDGHHEVTRIRVTATDGGSLRLVGPGAKRDALEPQESLALEAIYSAPNLSEDDLRRLYTKDTFERPLRLGFEFKIDGEPIRIERDILTTLKPALELTVTPRTLLIPRGVKNVPFVVAVRRKATKGRDFTVRVKAPAGMRINGGVQDVTMAAHERFREFTFTLHAPQARDGVSAMHVHVGGQRIRVGVHRVDVAVREDLRVGLIAGVDTTSYEVLRSLVGDARLEKFETGQTLPILSRERLDTVVVDIRALRTSSHAKSGFARLLQFVSEGGRLVVFYHKDNEFNLQEAKFRGAPFPLEIGKGRVTREDAPVRILVPDHSLFRTPNTILVKDWDGWKQERGLYFPARYDERYQSLLEMQDPGQPAERGALLYARYGKGDYIYCALSLYRQLKNRHPGACRLFANLISAPK